MDAGSVAKALPFTAWEQAVFVALFIILVIAILAWVSRENKASREFQQSESTAREKAQSQRDAEWRSFFELLQGAEKQNNLAVKESLDALVEVTRSLADEVRASRADFQAHDGWEQARLAEMSATIHQRPARAPKG